MEHFQSPINRGVMECPSVIGKASLDGYPPFVTLYLRLESDQVTAAKFEAEGCGVTIACGSMLTQLVRHRNPAECRAITVETLSQALDCIPTGKEYCAAVTISALHDAIRRWDESVSGMAGKYKAGEE
jgi:NifU-like protein involved in Fe-S cluster formation